MVIGERVRVKGLNLLKGKGDISGACEPDILVESFQLPN